MLPCIWKEIRCNCHALRKFLQSVNKACILIHVSLPHDCVVMDVQVLWTYFENMDTIYSTTIVHFCQLKINHTTSYSILGTCTDFGY